MAWGVGAYQGGWGTGTYQPTLATNAPPTISGTATHVINEGLAFSADFTILNMDGLAPTLSGPDAGRFTITNVSGNTWRLAMTAKNYDNPQDANGDNVYQVTINANDGVNPVVTLAITVTINNVASEIPNDSFLSFNSEIEAIYQGETGRPFRLYADFDLSANTDLNIIFVDPNGQVFTKTKADGVALGVVDITDRMLGDLAANSYVEYSTEDDLLLTPGKWMMQLAYINTNAAPVDRQYGEVVVFEVRKRPGLQ